MMTSILQPTFRGKIDSKLDECILYEACLSGILSHIWRFPTPGETQSLTEHGNVFVYADPPTGPGNWNDGRAWILISDEVGIRHEKENSRSSSLYKKSGSFLYQGTSHYFVSYYSIKVASTLQAPSQSPLYRNISLRVELSRLVS